jgi:quinoprotein dehydrogenase-associated probable ABC transporter substrate-binding protein
MCSRFRNADLLRAFAAGIAIATAASAGGEPLRVCADPNNLPFSDRQGRGFENELAEFVARMLDRDGVAYTWHPQRRGFVRNTLNTHACDIVMGVPEHYELTATTRPYYRSTYVFVARDDAGKDIARFGDARLRDLKIGVHAVGDDYSSTPAAIALGRHGLIRNMVGYSIYGNYADPNPPARLIEAVARGDVDVAVAWGPLAGYFATREPVPLMVTPVDAHEEPADVPFVFGIAMGVRRDDTPLRAALDAVILAHGTDIDALLQRYGVPLVPRLSPAAAPIETEGAR